MFDWVDILESKLDSMPPVGTDVDTVKQQLADLKVRWPGVHCSAHTVPAHTLHWVCILKACGFHNACFSLLLY